MLQGRPSCLPLAPKMTSMWNHAGIRNQSSRRDPRDCPRERRRCLPKGSTWIGSDSQAKVSHVQKPFGLSIPYKSCIWLLLTWRQQKEENSNRFPLTVVRTVTKLYWWKLVTLMGYREVNSSGFYFTSKFWFQTQFSVATALSVDKKGLRAIQWCQVNTEGHCCWAAAGQRLCPHSITSHHSTVVTLRKTCSPETYQIIHWKPKSIYPSHY